MTTGSTKVIFFLDRSAGTLVLTVVALAGTLHLVRSVQQPICHIKAIYEYDYKEGFNLLYGYILAILLVR